MQKRVIEVSITKTHMHIIRLFDSFFTFDNNLQTVHSADAR